jgi:hypothetical protein
LNCESWARSGIATSEERNNVTNGALIIESSELAFAISVRPDFNY